MKKNQKILIKPIYFSFLSLFFSCDRNTAVPANNGWEALSASVIGKPIDLALANAESCYVISLGTTPYLHNVLTHSNNGGKNWFQLEYSKAAYNDTSYGALLSIFASPFDIKTIFVSRSNLLRSINGGYTYHKVDMVNRIGTPLMHFFDPKNGISAGSCIAKTYDSGYNWTKVYDPTSLGYGFQFLQFTSNNVGYVAGGDTYDAFNSGTILKTIDGGNTWKTLSFPPHNLTGLNFISSSTGFCAINLDSASIATTYRRGCALYKTTDFGETWTLVNNSLYEKYGAYAENIYFKNELEGYFSSWVGIFHTSDGGVNWQREIPNCIYRMRVAQNVAYALDSAGIILKKIL